VKKPEASKESGSFSWLPMTRLGPTGFAISVAVTAVLMYYRLSPAFTGTTSSSPTSTSHPVPANPLTETHCKDSTNWHTLVKEENPLGAFSDEYKAEMLWGTYRPQAYFGLRSRTSPDFFAMGLMWKGNGDANWRHSAQEGNDSPQQWGWQQHDGRRFGRQVIKDGQAELTTVFLKPEPDKRSSWSWVASIDVNTPAGSPVDWKMYMANGEETSADIPTLKLTPASSGDKHGTHVWKGFSNHFGHFAVVFDFVTHKGKVGSKVQSCANEAEIEKAVLENAQTSGGLSVVSVSARFGNKKKNSQTRVNVFFVPLDSADADVPPVPPDTEVQTAIQNRKQAFHAKFAGTFGLSGEFDAKQVSAAEFSLSNLVGGMGYFYGSVQIDGKSSSSQVEPSALFTACPSRAFFPRGFLWDEGFHMAVLARWDYAIALDSVGHWLGSAMRQCTGVPQAGGWIPREQILGAYAISRVPDWALSQDVGVANPPTLLMALQDALAAARKAAKREKREREAKHGGEGAGSSGGGGVGSSGGGGGGGVDVEQFAAAAVSRAEKWVKWLEMRLRRNDLSGPTVKLNNSTSRTYYRWSDRKSDDSRLHPNTLSSGLDDYPRASRVNVEEEAHVDAASWVAWSHKTLSSLLSSSSSSSSSSSAQELDARANVVVDMLQKGGHFDSSVGGFFDLGRHSENGKFTTAYVFRCQAQNGKTTDISMPMDQRGPPPCPRQFPKPLYPLGDGQGGMLMRPLYVESAKRPYRRVPRLGYVAIFPLILGLLDHDAAQVLLQLKFMKQHLLGPHGLRSLSQKDKFYNRENAPGDAPYWRGPIWMPINYLALRQLHRYRAHSSAAVKELASELYQNLRTALINTVLGEYSKTGWVYEQYNDKTGRGQKSRPFTGWTATIVTIMAEAYD